MDIFFFLLVYTFTCMYNFVQYNYVANWNNNDSRFQFSILMIFVVMCLLVCIILEQVNSTIAKMEYDSRSIV